MPRGETTHGLDSGTQLEVRVCQAWFWDGYYVRRGIDLQHRFGSDVSTITDLDLLAYDFDQALISHKYIGEVKSGKSNNTPRPIDRAVWARGLRELVGAERAEVTTAFRASASIREFTRGMGVVLQHVKDLDERETRLRILDVDDSGSQGVSVAKSIEEVHRFLKKDSELERAYWFLRSEVWFLQPFDALKRTIGLLRQLQSHWPVEADKEAVNSMRWLYAESLSIFGLQITTLCGLANSMDYESFVDTAVDLLAAGDVSIQGMRRLSARVDEYVTKLLNATDAPIDLKVNALGAFEPLPPPYAEPLIELIGRLATSAATMSRLPRQLDLIAFERIFRRRELSYTLRDRAVLDEQAERAIRLIAAFLRGQIGLPAQVDRALRAPISAGPRRPEADPEDGQVLF